MKNMKLRKIICLLLVTCSSCSFFAGCTDDINNYEKQTAAEASNKVFISDKYASLAFNAQRTVEGKVANMDTLVAKLVVNCTSPAGGNLTVKVTIDTLLVDVYNKKNETSYHRFASNWIRLNKSTLTIPEGSMESADTLTVALTRPLDGFTSMDGYIMPVRITSASGYDAQVDYNKRVSYLTLDVTQENGVGFEEGKNSVMVAGNESFTGCDLPLMAYIASDSDINIGLEVDNSLVAAFNSKYGTAFKTLAVSDWELADVALPAGSTTATGHIAYKGETSQFTGDNYLVPIKIKSVTSPGAAEPVKTMRTDVYYLVVNSVSGGYTLESMILRLVCDRQKGAVIKPCRKNINLLKAVGKVCSKEVSGYWMFRPVSQSIWDMKFAISPEYISGRTIARCLLQAWTCLMPERNSIMLPVFR